MTEKVPLTYASVARRSLALGIVNTFAGVLLFFLTDAVLNHLLATFLFVEVLLILIKTYLYSKFVFLGSRKRVVSMPVILIFIWGSLVSAAVMNLGISGVRGRFIVVILALFGNLVIILMTAFTINKTRNRAATQ